MKTTLNLKTRFIVILVLTVGAIISHTEAFRFKFTKIRCNCTDKTFCTFEICRVKAVSRNLQYVEIYLKFHQLPIPKVTARFRIMKRANDYKPFLYDKTLKCDFIKHLNPVTRILWSWFQDASNLNHSCPFVEDFKIQRLENIYIQRKLASLPIPDGEYALFVNVVVDNKTVFEAEFYASILYK